MTLDFIGRGWAYPLGVKPNGSMATTEGVARIQQAIYIILMTYLGERPMRPLFGSRLRDFIFDGVNESSAAEIAQEVQRAIESCEPRVAVDNVEARPMEGPYGGFDIDIHFIVLATNDEGNLLVPFYTIPGEEEE
jgi:phage baseplate assembly protein W